MLTPNLEGIPLELKARHQWVAFRPDKSPVDPKTGSDARANDPNTWAEFGQGVSLWQARQGNGIAGLGYEFSSVDPYCGVDLDKCRDPETGEIESWAKDIIRRLNSYTEISPSGRGVHILVKGKLPAQGRKKGQVEMYDSGRYFTMTGLHLEGTPTAIEDRLAELTALHSEIFTKSEKSTASESASSSIPLSDDELIQKISESKVGQKFGDLWRADMDLLRDQYSYSSPSEADLALCSIMAFWTGKDPEAMDRLFRRSNLMRSKWDEFRGGHTYGAITIEKAIAETSEVWKGAKQRNNGKPQNNGGSQDKEEKPTQAELLLKLASEAELFHSPEQEGYALLPINAHLETWPIRSKGFKRWLMRKFYLAEGKPPGSQAMQDALGVLEAKAQFDGPERPVFVRIGHMQGNIYLDLVNAAWEVVEITPAGWRIMATSPVCFRRARGMLPLPHPEPGGSVDELRSFINVATDTDFKLVLASLIASFRPVGPYPIPTIQGEQGSAKTTLAKVMRSMVDPSVSPVRSIPRDARDLMISAFNSWMLAYDNLSGLPEWLSDALCRLATGGGLSTRELYTDSEEIILEAQRPLLLNGIDMIAVRQDLADRVVILNLPQIKDGNRLTEKEFWGRFEQARPRILGALLNAVSSALHNYDSITLKETPRMADFAHWVTAAEAALGWPPGSFLEAYCGNREEAVAASLEADVVAGAVRALIADHAAWEGTPTELIFAMEGYVHENTRKSKAWPKTPNWLSNKLRRAAPFLRRIGIELEFGRKGNRKITIRKLPQNCVNSAHCVQDHCFREFPEGVKHSVSDKTDTNCVQPDDIPEIASTKKPPIRAEWSAMDERDAKFSDFSFPPHAAAAWDLSISQVVLGAMTAKYSEPESLLEVII